MVHNIWICVCELWKSKTSNQDIWLLNVKSFKFNIQTLLREISFLHFVKSSVNQTSFQAFMFANHKKKKMQHKTKTHEMYDIATIIHEFERAFYTLESNISSFLSNGLSISKNLLNVTKNQPIIFWFPKRFLWMRWTYGWYMPKQHLGYRVMHLYDCYYLMTCEWPLTKLS